MADENDVQVVFGAQIAGLVSGVEAVKDQLGTLVSAGAGVAEAFTGVGEAMAAIFVVDKIDAFVEKIGDLGLQVERTATQLGLTTAQVSLLNYAAETNDVSTSQMRNSLERLTVGIESAANGAGRQAAAFKMLSGETAEEFIRSGGSMADAVQLISEHTAKLGPNANLAGAYISLMGRSGADAIPVFKELGTDIDGLKDKVLSAGLAFSPGMTEGIADTRKANIDLKEATSGLGVSIFSILKPAIDVAILGFRGFIQNLQDSTQYGGVLWGVMEGLTGGFLILETAVIGVADVIKLVFQALLTGINAALAMVQTTATVLGDVIHGKFTQIGADIKAGNANVVKVWQDGMTLISHNTQGTIDKMGKSWSEYFASITNGAKTAGKQVAGAFNSTEGPKIPGLDDAKRLMQQDIEQQKAAVELASSQLGNNLEARKQLWMDYYAWLKAKYPQDVKDQDAALKQVAELNNKTAAQTTATWTKYFNDFNQGLNGMLRGTSTWQQSVSNIFWKVVLTFEQMVEKQIAAWLVKETTQTAATTTGNAARLASDTAAAASGSAVTAAASGKTIMADAAKAYAGTYAFLSPAMGPFAAIPAGAAFAAVAGFESLASFDVGSWNVPVDQVAMVHAGERIMTAEENRSFSAGAGGGSGLQVHFNGPVYGMRDFNQAVATAVKQSARNFNPDLVKAIKT